MNSAATTTGRAACRHCRRNLVGRPRGLCWTCYGDLDVRGLYPSAVALGHCADGAGQAEGPTPPDPTPHRPGSPEKVSTLEARLAAGHSLWHPADAAMRD